VTEIFKLLARRISETPDEVLLFSFSLLSLTGLLIAVYWYYNRRKMHQLSHQIPAVVVKNYLDSIIQNSSALKSSLFRGGGLELGNGIPSVVPVGDLPSGNVNVSSGFDSEELNQRLAEIAKLTKRLAEKENLIKDLEKRLSEVGSGEKGSTDDRSEEVASLKAEIQRLKEMLDNAPTQSAGESDDSALRSELAAVTTERDELKERLMEYEIIEEDLANLKRLQQENEQLKRQLAGGAATPASTPVVPEPKEEVAVQEPAQESEEMSLEDEMAAAISSAPTEPEDDTEAEMAQAISEPADIPAPQEEQEEPKKASGDQKSAEELLSEFEKMLG
jgi:myosin heavy subunit